VKTAVILSDTHGNFSAIEKILPIMQESDFVIHLGDFQRDIFAYEKELGKKIISVKGNCDGGGEDRILEIEKVKILITHGNKYSVKSNMLNLIYVAKEKGVNAVFYGHTHVSDTFKQDGILFVNPGCMSGFYEKTYCYAVFHDGKVTTKNVEVRD